MAPRVMVVDDDPSVCESVSRILLRENYSVKTCLSAKESIALLEKEHFDAVITDMMMPGMSGLDLLKEVKQRWPITNVVIITGYATIKTAVLAIKWGAFDYIPKPFSMDEIAGVAARAVARSAVEKERVIGVVAPPPPQEAVIPTTEESIIAKLEKVYSIREHCWAMIEDDGTVRFGVDAMFLRTAKDVIYIDLPMLGDLVEQGRACVKMTSKEHKIYKVWAPVSGEIIAVNEGIGRNLDLLFQDPYGKGWLLRIRPTCLDEETVNLTKGL